MALFGWSRRGERQDALENVIGPTTSLRGHIKSDGGARIDGRFEGRIEVAGNVVVTEKGHVVGDIFARDVTIGGTVEGNVEGAGRLEILATGKLFGDVTAAAILIDDGGLFEGISRMRGAARPALPAPAEALPALEEVVIDLDRRPGSPSGTAPADPLEGSARTVDEAADIPEGTEPAADAGAPEAVQPPTEAGPAPDPEPPDAPDAATESAVETASAAPPRLSKVAARLVAENGLDASAIRGTGHRGMITKADVRRALAAKRREDAAARRARRAESEDRAESMAETDPPSEAADSAASDVLDLSALNIEPVIPDTAQRATAETRSASRPAASPTAKRAGERRGGRRGKRRP